MKKILVLIFVNLFLLSCVSCATTSASIKAVSVGKQAIVILDDYLDGKQDYKSAYEQVEELFDQMKYAESYNEIDYSDRTDEQKADKDVYFYLLSSKIYLISDNMDRTPESYAKVLEIRNELAQVIGVSDR